MLVMSVVSVAMLVLHHLVLVFVLVRFGKV
jgi:hypothetical protein